MKIMHTSDWHLGKKTEGKDRITEQKQVLGEICFFAKENSVDIVLICGDVFDTYTPSAEAEDLFYESVTALCDSGKRLVIVIAGNHDDPVRLCAASSLAQKNAIIINGGGDECYNFPSHCAIKLINYGKNFVKVDINGEQAVINYLSYPSDSRLSEIADGKIYSEKIAGYLKNGNENFSDGTINITLSHLFAAGAQPTGEEREIEAGGIKACSIKVFSDKCHYTALGHIHRHQKIGENIFYSGSILQYSVDESSEKSVIVFDVDNSGVLDFKRLYLKSGKKLISFTASSFNEAAEFLKSCNDFVYLKIRQNKPLLYEESKQLKSYDNLLSIDLEFEGQQNLITDLKIKKNLSKTELFTAFFQQKFNSKPESDLLNLFLEIIDDN